MICNMIIIITLKFNLFKTIGSYYSAKFNNQQFPREFHFVKP